MRNTAEYSYDRATDADPDGEFHLALGAPLARYVTQAKITYLHCHPHCREMFSSIGLLTSVRQEEILISFGRNTPRAGAG